MNKIIKFLGIQIGKEYIENEVYRKRILFHETKFNLNETHITYRFLGIKYLTVNIGFGETTYNFLNIIKIKKLFDSKKNILIPILIDYIKEKLKMDSFDAIAIYSHSGEAFLALHHIKEFIEKNQIKKPLLLFVESYNENISRMFYPDIPCFTNPIIFFALYSVDLSPIEYGNCTFRLVYNTPYYYDLHNKVALGNKKYFYEGIKKTMNVSSELSALPVISEKDKENAEVKMKLIGLKKPFIYIATSSLITESCSKDFWEKLPVELYKLGQKLNGGGGTTCSLTHSL